MCKHVTTLHFCQATDTVVAHLILDMYTRSTSWNHYRHWNMPAPGTLDNPPCARVQNPDHFHHCFKCNQAAHNTSSPCSGKKQSKVVPHSGHLQDNAHKSEALATQGSSSNWYPTAALCSASTPSIWDISWLDGLANTEVLCYSHMSARHRKWTLTYATSGQMKSHGRKQMYVAHLPALCQVPMPSQSGIAHVRGRISLDRLLVFT